jgi:S-adenosylmethionine:tRNA ribosyltransferase-isomerase
MMMGAAFAGYNFLFEAYEEAFEEEYQLFAFGDTLFIK